MQTIQVATGAAPTKICDGGPRDFIHIKNNSGTVIYIQYDGDTANTLTNGNDGSKGWPLNPQESLTLDNTGPVRIYNKPVYAIHNVAGNQELRVMGV